MNLQGHHITSLIGPRCTGKTSIGHRLSELLDVGFIDLDAKLVELYAKECGTHEPGPGAVLEKMGEPAFRQLEARALRQALAVKTPCVLATGGGVVELGAHRRLLRERTNCVRLIVSPELLRARLAADPTPRPALLGEDAVAEIDALIEKRETKYAETAHVTIDCGADDVDSLAHRIQTVLDARS